MPLGGLEEFVAERRRKRPRTTESANQNPRASPESALDLPPIAVLAPPESTDALSSESELTVDAFLQRVTKKRLPPRKTYVQFRKRTRREERDDAAFIPPLPAISEESEEEDELDPDPAGVVLQPSRKRKRSDKRGLGQRMFEAAASTGVEPTDRFHQRVISDGSERIPLRFVSDDIRPSHASSHVPRRSRDLAKSAPREVVRRSSFPQSDPGNGPRKKRRPAAPQPLKMWRTTHEMAGNKAERDADDVHPCPPLTWIGQREAEEQYSLRRKASQELRLSGAARPTKKSHRTALATPSSLDYQESSHDSKRISCPATPDPAPLHFVPEIREPNPPRLLFAQSSSPVVTSSTNNSVAPPPENDTASNLETAYPPDTVEPLEISVSQQTETDLQLPAMPVESRPRVLPPKLPMESENSEPRPKSAFAHASTSAPSTLPALVPPSDRILSAPSSKLTATSPARRIPPRPASRSGQLSPVNLNIRPSLPRTPNLVLCPDSDELSPPHSISVPPPTNKSRLRPLESFMDGFYKTARSASQATRPKTATGVSQGRRTRPTQRRPATATTNSYAGIDLQNSMRSTAEGFGLAEQDDESDERWLKDEVGDQDIAGFILTNDGRVALR